MRGSDPLASPAAGEATSPGNWMLTMPSASSSTPFSPVQPVYEMQSRAQQHQMHGKDASCLMPQAQSPEKLMSWQVALCSALHFSMKE